MRDVEKTSPATRYGFALAAMAGRSAFQIVTVLGLRFLTDSLALSAAVAGSIFALVRLWDGVVDPLVGYISDRTRSRWGRRTPFLLAGSILMPLCLVGLFAAPHLGPPALLAAFVALILMLHGTGYSLMFVPLTSMIVEATDDYHERSRIMTYRTNGGFFSNILGSTLPPWLLVTWGLGRAGYARMGMTVAALLLVVGVAAVAMLRGARATRAENRPAGNLLAQAALAWRNKPFRVLVLVHVIFMVGVSTSASSNAYFTRYVLHRTDAWLGVFYIFLTLGNIVASPFWMRVSRLWDKKRTYCVALFLYGLGLASWMLSGPSEPYWLLAGRVLLVGMSMSGVVLMAYSMLTDAVRYDYIQSGHRREGAFSGFVSLIDKLAGAIGLAGMGLLLSKMGYAASSQGAALQSHTATLGVMMSFSAIPAATAFLSIALLRFYTLRESDLREAVRVAEPPLVGMPPAIAGQGP